MPRFIGRIRRSLRRSRQASFAEHRTPSLDLNEEEDYFAAREADRRSRVRSRPRTPAPLPVIVDRGPPTRNRYADDDIFWNSAMVEADPSVQSSSQTHDRTNTEVHNRNATNEAASSSMRPPFNTARTEAEIDKRLRRRRGLEQLQRGISYGRERADNDLNVFSYHRVDYDLPHVLDNGRSESPISPGTKAYDDFMDFPFHESAAENTNETSRTTTIGIAITTSGDQRVVLDAPNSSSGRSQTITWNSCLNDTLNNRHLDPEMRQAVLDRVHAMNTTQNGTNVGIPHVSLAEAGLEPNFSRPVVASGFYDRDTATADPPSSMTDGPDYFSRHHENMDLYEDPPATNGTASPVASSHTHQLPNGISISNRGIASSSSSSDETVRPARPSNPNHNSQQELNDLLSSHLSQDHMSLLQTTLHPPSNGTAINTSSLTPSSPTDPTTLILSLHTIITGLSDRIHQTEEVLIPSLSTTLERKTKAIDLLLSDIKALEEYIGLLGSTLDFGNSVLEGCWARTFENLRTLGGIRKRSERGGWWGRRRGGERDERDGNRRDTRGRGERDARQSVNGQELSKKELAAMILMAKQNVSILTEDIEDMMAMVEFCQDEQPVLKGVELAKEVNGDDEDERDV